MASNSQVVHIWAQQNGKDAKGGNIHSTGRSLYSYSTEIARFIEGRAVYTSHTYSKTTSGKHLNKVPGAVRHLESYQTPREIRDLPDTWEEVAPLLFVDMMIGIKSEIERLRKARRVRFSLSELATSINKCHKFYSDYISQSNPPQLPPNAITLPQLLSLWSNNATTGDGIVEKYLCDKFGIEIAKKLANEAAQDKKDSNKRLQAELDRLKSLETKIQEWRNHERSDLPHGAPTMLRLSKDGKTVQTSHGANVPADHARGLYGLIHSKCRIEGIKIGEFTVNSCDAETLTVGCHKIPLPEVEMIAKALGCSVAPSITENAENTVH